MQQLSKDTPDIAANWLRYCMALMRATNREMTEFSDSCLIAAQISLRAAKDNPMTTVQSLEVLEHSQALISKGMMAAQEKLTGYLFDQFSHDVLEENVLARESHLYRLATTAWETFRVKYLGGVPTNRPMKNFTPEEFQEGMELSAQWIRALDVECRGLGARLAGRRMVDFGRRRPTLRRLHHHGQDRPRGSPALATKHGARASRCQRHPEYGVSQKILCGAGT